MSRILRRPQLGILLRCPTMMISLTLMICLIMTVTMTNVLDSGDITGEKVFSCDQIVTKISRKPTTLMAFFVVILLDHFLGIQIFFYRH